MGIEPAGDIESLRGIHNHVDAMELVAEIDPKGAPMVELSVLRSPDAEEVTRIMFLLERGYRDRTTKGRLPGVISIDNTRSSILPDVLSRPPETAAVALEKSEPLKLRVFIDRTVVEMFANGKQCVALRVHPGREDSLGVSLRAQGQDAQLQSLDVWQMKNIYETAKKDEAVGGEQVSGS